VTSAFSTFLDRTGVPLLTVSLNCASGSKASVNITQERFLPLGSKGSRSEYWQTPACFEYESNGKIVRECSVVADPKDTIVLGRSAGCPAWLNANAGGTGYYRVRYEGQAADKILANVDKLDLTEKVDLLRNALALLTAGQMPADQALALVGKFKDSSDRQLISAALAIATAVDRSVPAELREKYARFILATFGARARELGMEPKPGESDDTRLLRRELVYVAARYGDEQLIAAAKQVAGKWLADRNSVDPNIAGTALEIAAQHGDRAYYDRLVAELRKPGIDRRESNRIVDAIASFRDPDIAKDALQLMLDPAIDVRDVSELLFKFNDEPETERLAWPFLAANYDKLLPRLPSLLGTHAGSRLPFAGTGFCDEKGYREVESFFKERVKSMPGAERNLAKTLEVIQLCGPSREAQRAGVVKFLQAW
jgi:alanyl aminopeptidase